uniref:hypothetical protein n=1 Tax=Xanthomonas oryzae TaxID=347 RepID=UPI003DA0514E
MSDITNTNNYKATGISLSGGYAAGGSDGKDGAKTDTQTPPTTTMAATGPGRTRARRARRKCGVFQQERQ